ncbi:unnamed protein product [Ilex paraguariensis]|uniref:Protein NUCLEAR FUSION DEFECTIVE 6, chloroplastic/mitochondrial-like n=1 Tax=Ilex paraguariensis TaxID=185542 RepID=A0ABC8TF06_9AQUA
MSASRVVPRLSSLSHKLFNAKPTTHSISPLKAISQSPLFASPKRISAVSRLPVELSCLMSMMPLHSAIASARLRSFLSVESQSWGLIPQGISMPL